MTPDKLWKKAQREIANRLGAENTGQVKGISSPLRLGDLANLLKSGKRVTILADKE